MTIFDEQIKEKLTVLIVDDLPTNLKLISDILYYEGMEIILSKDGDSAIATAINKQPDLILLDVNMPKMSGFEICKILKGDARTSDIPVIFLTAKVDAQDVIQGFKAGGVDYITKPFNPVEVVARVKTHLELQQKSKKLLHLNQELETKVSKRTAELEEAYRHMNKLDKAKNDFFLLINHELRTPINGILGFSEMLKHSTSPAKKAKFLHFIEEQADRLLRLSELAMLFTSLRGKGYQMKKQTHSLKKLIDQSIDRISQKYIEKTPIILSDLDQDLPVLVDSNLMLSVLDIIIGNAVKYSPKRGRIFIKTKVYGQDLCIDVQDSGEGFPKEVQDKLKNFLASDELLFPNYGFGLGLATTKLIMDTFNGKIEIKNHENQGATVSLFFKRV